MTFKIILGLLLFYLFFKISSTDDSEIWQEDLLPVETGGDEEEYPLPPKLKSIPYALSPSHLIALSHQEEKLYDLLVNYEHELLQRLETIRRYKSDYEDTSLRLLNQMTSEENPWEKHFHISANPILSHRMIRRFTNEINYLRQHIIKDLEINLHIDIENLKGYSYEWPEHRDLTDSMSSLIRITDTYDINIMEFSDGKSKSQTFYKSYAGLTALQCFEIGSRALEMSDTVTASDWLQAAYTKVVSEQDMTVDVETISQVWKNTVEQHARRWKIQENLVTDEIFEEAKKYDKSYFASLRGKRTEESLNVDYVSLCQGEEMQTEAEKSKLYCWYETEKHPYWKINPQKMELRSSDPYLIQIHDFVRLNVLDVITKAFIPVMSHPQRSSVATNNENTQSDVRTSVTGWLNKYDAREYPEIIQLFRKIESITNLHVLKPDSSEDYQLASYAYGSHYVPHLDTLSSGNFTSPLGDRLATFIIYLEEAFMGTETVFPQIGVSVKPIKGSALFWYNLHRNGSTDTRTHHGGCPLREGFKMITTNWIYDQENFLKRPCSMTQYE